MAEEGSNVESCGAAVNEVLTDEEVRQQGAGVRQGVGIGSALLHTWSDHSSVQTKCLSCNK